MKRENQWNNYDAAELEVLEMVVEDAEARESATILL